MPIFINALALPLRDTRRIATLRASASPEARAEELQEKSAAVSINIDAIAAITASAHLGHADGCCVHLASGEAYTVFASHESVTATIAAARAATDRTVFLVDDHTDRSFERAVNPRQQGTP